MSILEKMRQYEAERQMKLQQGENTLMPETQPNEVVIQSLGLKPRRPSLRSMIGDNNPLTDDEYQELSALFKFGRTQE